MQYYIYKITNTKNNKVYIGYSQCPDRRWATHKKCVLKGTKGVLYDAMRKHGLEHFDFEIIYTNSSKTKTKNIKEPQFIKEYNSVVPNGYNVALGGAGGATRCGATLNELTRQKISNSVKRYMDNPDVRKQISVTRKKRVTKQSTREKMSKNRSRSRWYSNHQLKQSIFRYIEQEQFLLSEGWVKGRIYNFNPRAWI